MEKGEPIIFLEGALVCTLFCNGDLHGKIDRNDKVPTCKTC